MVVSRNPQDALILQNKLKNLTAHIEKANSVQSDLIDNPNDYDTKSNTLDVLANTSRAMKKFHDDIDNELLADFIDSLNSISDSKAEYTAFGSIIKKAQAGKIDEVELQKDVFLSECQRVLALIEHIANRIAPENEKVANEIMLKKNKLYELLPGLLSAIDIRAASCQDQTTKELLGTMVGMWEDDVKELQNIAFNSFDGIVVVVGTGIQFNHSLIGRTRSFEIIEQIGNFGRC